MNVFAKPLFRRIIQTVAYTDQFEYPLDAFQVWQRLLEITVSYQEIQRSLQVLVAEGVLATKNGWYFFVGRESSVQKRHIAEKYAQQMDQATQELLAIVQILPWIEAVAITGSVAMGVAAKNDDLDLMIITKPGFLWLSRFMLVIVASIKGRRRYWWEDRAWKLAAKNKKSEQITKTKWCFNLWLTSASLAVPSQMRSVYAAYEVCQADFVYDVSKVQARFLAQNKWAKKYVPQYFSWRSNQAKQVAFLKKNLFIEVIEVAKPVFVLVDVVLFWLQWGYMQRHITTEKVSRLFAYFHPRPTNKLVRSGWKKALLTVIKRRSNQQLQQLQQLRRQDSEQQQKNQPFKLSDQTVLFLKNSRKKGQKVVLVTGVFDMLHSAHRQFLVQAKMTGDVLVVALESDKRVTELKGVGRPINNQEKRREQMKNLGIADGVVILPEDFSTEERRLEVLRLLHPDTLAVSAHSPFIENKKKLMEEIGGTVKVVMAQDPTISTTALLKRLAKN
jgi:cytidyltransferase-like protein